MPCDANKAIHSFNSLCPAPLNTPLLQDWLGDDQAKRHRREIHFPTGRFGEAIEQAHAVVFLASDESSFVIGTDFTGESLRADTYEAKMPDYSANHISFHPQWTVV
jgi:NAD(P)-dependent dehydrogenase (short-subunit alcohol dehydrogenase family)